MVRELGSDRRETGWSPIYYERGFLRRVVLSKKLLLHREICDENVTHNGEAFICFDLKMQQHGHANCI